MPAVITQKSLIKVIVCFQSENYIPWGPGGTQSSPRETLELTNPKILVIKVIRYNQPIMKIPLIGGLTHCVVLGELEREFNVPPLLPAWCWMRQSPLLSVCGANARTRTSEDMDVWLTLIFPKSKTALRYHYKNFSIPTTHEKMDSLKIWRV